MNCSYWCLWTRKTVLRSHPQFHTFFFTHTKDFLRLYEGSRITLTGKFLRLVSGQNKQLSVTFWALYWQPSTHTWTVGNTSSIENLWLYSQFCYNAINTLLLDHALYKMKTRRVGFNVLHTGCCNRVTANTHMRKFSSHKQRQRSLIHQSRYSQFALTKHESNCRTDYILTIHAVLRRAGMLEGLPTYFEKLCEKWFVH